jgi:4-amino-4-deoxy-L-arabinose transferase-like glycosyltransferase
MGEEPIPVKEPAQDNELPKDNSSLEKRKDQIKTSMKNGLFGWVEDNYDKVFLMVLAAAFIIRIFIFLKTSQQPLWWDEGDYLATAKNWGLGLNLRDMWYYRRGFLWPAFSALFFWLGLGEGGIRFSEVLFSTGIVAVSYFVIKEMSDKKRALFVSILLSFSWIMMFFTGRVLTEMPSSFFLLLSLLFFWKGYVKKQGSKFLYLFSIFFAIAVLIRMQVLMFAPVFLLFMFANEKFKFFKNKTILISLGIFAVILIPHIYLYWTHYGNPIADILGHYFGIKGVSGVYTERTLSTTFDYFTNLSYIIGGLKSLGILLFFSFIVGIFYFFSDLALGFDKIFKNPMVQKKFFIFLWIVIPFLVLGYITSLVEQRYAIPSLPFIFLIALSPLFKLEDYLMKNSKVTKKTAFVIVLLIVVMISIPNITWGNELTESKASSYPEIMQAGLWIKENTNVNDVIISQSYPQITYYAERSTYPPNYKNRDLEGFEELIKEQNPKYYMISAIEISEDWTYTYPESANNTLTPVWIYPPQSQQPTVIIYQFNNYEPVPSQENNTVQNLTD